MRVLITGGAGFIGSHLVERFLTEGYQVRVLDNLHPRVHPFGKPKYLPSEVEFICGSVTDREVLEKALKGVDVISHQAAYQDYMLDFSQFLLTNSVSTALIFEILVERKWRPRKVIVASSQAVYGEGQYRCPEHGLQLPPSRGAAQMDRGEWELLCPACSQVMEPLPLEESRPNPWNQYAVSKLSGEQIGIGLGRIHGIPAVALRYSITQGPRQSLYNHYSGLLRIFTSRALAGQPLIVYEDGRQRRDFVHVADVVEANMHVLADERADFQAFNVGSGVPTTVLEYARKVIEHSGSAVPVTVPREYRIGDNRHSVSSIGRLTALGWKPQRDLDTNIREFMAWVESTGGIPADYEDAYRVMRDSGVVRGVCVS